MDTREILCPQELLTEGKTEAWKCLWVYFPFHFDLYVFCADTYSYCVETANEQCLLSPSNFSLAN